MNSRRKRRFRIHADRPFSNQSVMELERWGHELAWGWRMTRRMGQFWTLDLHRNKYVHPSSLSRVILLRLSLSESFFPSIQSVVHNKSKTLTILPFRLLVAQDGRLSRRIPLCRRLIISRLPSRARCQIPPPSTSMIRIASQATLEFLAFSVLSWPRRS